LPVTRDFRYYLRVRYSECDAQKVVFNARYGDYVGLATAEFLRAAGMHQEFFDGDLGYQLVKQTIEWRAPARFDQILELSVSLIRLGNSSFTIGTNIRMAGQEPVLATAETVLVLIDERIMKSVRLTDRHRESLTNGAPGGVADHAGYLACRGGALDPLLARLQRSCSS